MPKAISGADKRKKKLRTINDLYAKFTEYEQIILVSLENVSSSQMAQIRQTIRESPDAGKGATLVVGKNTLVRKAIDIRMTEPTPGTESYEYRKHYWDLKGKGTPENPGIEQLEVLKGHIKNRVAMVFTREFVGNLKPRIEALTKPSKAKVGMFAPCDVTVPKGPTGIDPSDIKFFHALKMSTKIQKGQIEITAPMDVIFKGEMVGDSEAKLLAKLNITPFEYGMHVRGVYYGGKMLDEEFFSMSQDAYVGEFAKALKNVQALSMATAYHTQASVASTMIFGFKQLLALSSACGIKSARFDAVWEGASAVQAQAATGGDGAGAEEEVEEAPKVEAVKVSLGGGGGLFGGDSSSDDDDSDDSDEES